MFTRDFLFPFVTTCLAVSASAQTSDPLEHALHSSQPRQVEADHAAALESFQGTLSIRDAMTRPIQSRGEQGRVWARTRDQRASLDRDGLTVFPVFGPQSPREWPVQFEVESVTRGGDQLAKQALADAQQSEGRMELVRGSMREVYHLGLDGIEQTFVFDQLAGDGDLVVELDVETDLAVRVDGDELSFEHETFGGVRYGEAFVVDAAGRRQAIERSWNGEGIELRVPDAFLDSATLPVTIDPVIHTFTSGFGIADDRQPDIVWAGQENRYFVCWQEYTSAANADVYLTSFSPTGGGQGDSIAIDQSSQDWRYPRMAYAYGPNRLLIAAAVDQNSGNCRVKGQIVNADTVATEGNSILISTEGNNKGFVDVGGTTHDATTNAFFNVVWSHYSGPGDSVAQFRIINWNGAHVTPIQYLTNWVDASTQTTISNSLGDLGEAFNYWTIAWVKDTDGNGRGSLWAQRIRWDGDDGIGGGIFLVDGATNCALPSATSLFDTDLEDNGERPSIIAYEKRYTAPEHPLGFQRSISAKVVTFGEAHAHVEINRVLEDFDGDLDQTSPSIATDGTSFVLSYAEENWNAIGSGNYDMYMVTGNIAERENFVGLALGERHVALDDSGFAERQGVVCTRWDGETDTVTDDGAVLWVRETSTQAGYGLLAGATYDIITSNGISDRAVGVQYCDAYPNSTGTYGGRNSGWLWMRGAGDLLHTHRAIATDLPPFKTGLLVVAPQSGSVDFPGGSFGRLCLAGGLGRYASQIQSSGALGAMEFDVDPMALPTPTGLHAALPGESWYFQVWHRDHDGGGASSSNFTNAVRVVWKP